MTSSFVETLAIASEPRLHRFRPPEPEGFAPRRGGQKPPARAAAPPEVVTDKMRAAVDAGSIVSFVGGSTKRRRAT